MSRLNELSDDQFAGYVVCADSIRNLAELMGYRRQSGGVQRLIKQRIVRQAVDVSHFGARRRQRLSEGKRKYSTEEILVENSTYTNIAKLKKRLIKEKILEYVCKSCGNDGNWLGKPLALQLDHENGKPSDHRRHNLRFLCPNCHAQTPTYCGKNKMA